MCNHYEKNVDVLKMAADEAERLWVINNQGDVIHPDDARIMRDLPEHTWPKSIAPVVVKTAAGCHVVPLRWGIRVEVQGARQPLVKYVTNARDGRVMGAVDGRAAERGRCHAAV